MNTKKTSSQVGTLASKILQNTRSSQIAKSLAASALSQRDSDKQTSTVMEETAARVLASDHYADDTRALAASVLSQSNKQR